MCRHLLHRKPGAKTFNFPFVVVQVQVQSVTVLTSNLSQWQLMLSLRARVLFWDANVCMSSKTDLLKPNSMVIQSKQRSAHRGLIMCVYFAQKLQELFLKSQSSTLDKNKKKISGWNNYYFNKWICQLWSENVLCCLTNSSKLKKSVSLHHKTLQIFTWDTKNRVLGF